MKELLEDIKLNKVAYLVEILEKRDNEEKLKAYKKLQKISISKNIGLYLIQNSYKNFGIDDDFGGIGSSLIELCFKNYYDEYTSEIKKVFDKLNKKARRRVVYLLTTTINRSALELYADLILKYFKDEEIPIGNLYSRPDTYSYIFPKLYKALKFKNTDSNILVLISNYLNSGVVPKQDLKKNKKLVIDAICKLFDETIKSKFSYKNSFEALNNFEYKHIRYYLELAINIELYVSNKTTKEYLEKLYKKNDNQLKLFILDNYIRSEVDIKKKNLLPIAKDLSSRYALYEFLLAYDMIELFPKKYLKAELLAESDFYTNFAITNAYLYEPKSIKLIKTVIRNEYKYYIFSFKCTYKYTSETSDFLTNYICSVVGIEKYNGQEITSDFIGISGGYNKDKEVSKVEYNLTSMLYKKLDNINDTDLVIEELLPKKIDIVTANDKKKKIRKNNIEIKEDKKKRYIFDYILLFLFFVFEVMLIYCMLYVNDIANIGGGVKKNPFKSSLLESSTVLEEINGNDIYSKPEEEYYVLLYKKKDENKSPYYTYINEYSKRNIKFYYVNLNKEENKFLLEPNNFGFVVNKERLLKVKKGEYLYYIDSRVNILNEMKKEIDEFKKQEAEAKNNSSKN